jgi:SAM-dependent methyltransferase
MIAANLHDWIAQLGHGDRILDLASASMDLVICNHALEHFLDLDAVLDEIGRVLGTSTASGATISSGGSIPRDSITAAPAIRRNRLGISRGFLGAVLPARGETRSPAGPSRFTHARWRIKQHPQST